MNRKYTLFPIIVFMLLILSCRSAEKRNLSVTLSGTIANPVTNYIVISGIKEFGPGVIDSVLTDENSGYLIAFALVNPQGNFSATFEIGEPGYVNFHYGNRNQWLYLFPGDSMRLSFNAEEPDEKIRFTGKGAAINNFLAEKYKVYDKIVPREKDLFSLQQDTFLLKIDSIKRTLLLNLQNFEDSVGPVNAEFVNHEKAVYRYAWTDRRFKYPRYHNYYAPDDSVKPGDAYYDFISQINLTEPNPLKTSYYINTLYGLLNYKKEKKFEKDSSLKQAENSETAVLLRLARELLSNEEIRNLTLLNILYTHLEKHGIYKTEEFLADFEKSCTNPEYLAIIRKVYSKNEIFAEGVPALAFAFPDINGDTVSLSDFSGKYVFIDVWATWCAPCKKELPHLEKLQEEFKEKNIVFISISVDNKKDSWKKMVKEKNMKGVQLYAGGWESSIVKHFKITEIPRFMLFDKEGKIITVQAPRPSENLWKILEKMEGI